MRRYDGEPCRTLYLPDGARDDDELARRVIISFSGLVGAGAIYFRHDLPKRSAMRFIAGALFAIIIAIQLIGGSIDRHFDVSGLFDEGRLQTYQSVVQIIVQHPWFGTGLGSFALAFPEYRTAQASILGIWDMAHSTPLQIAAEMGLPIACLVAAAWAGALVILARGVLIRQDSHCRILRSRSE